MKKTVENAQKLIKGIPSAVVVSILFHAGLFVLAGVLVIFTILPPPPVEFERPPLVKVPKMPLKKLQVRMKKPSKPKSTAKITAMVPKLDLHDIQFPDLASSGIGAGLGGGSDVVGFIDMPVFDEEGIFGKGVSIGNDLEVTFYDSKRSKSGRTLFADQNLHRDLVAKFIREGWDRSVFKNIYRSPKKRYATCVVIPATLSYQAPALFGAKDAYAGCWIALYRGQLVHPEDITFRFWTVIDDTLGIRVDGELVIAAGLRGAAASGDTNRKELVFGSKWSSSSKETHKYIISRARAVVGDWIELKAGEPRDLEIMIEDNNGWGFTAILAVEVKGVEYERSSQGGPILPVFKTSEISRDLLDVIYSQLAEKEMLTLTNGPVFCDY